MAKIAVAGISGNSNFMYADHFHESGETLQALSLYSEIGGKGINQAIAAARAGAEVSFLAAIGHDAAGEKCVEVCRENCVRGFFAKNSTPTATAFILTDKTGENRVTVYRGAQLSVSDISIFEEEVASCDVLLLQNEIPEDVNIELANIAQTYGKTVILNPAPYRPIPKSLAEKVFLVTPNACEAKQLELGSFKNYVITLGGEGCLVNGKITIPATDDTVLDTTGAGDTFNGVLAVCLAEGKSLEESCRVANVASGISVSRRYVLPSIPTRDEIERRIKK